MKKMSLLVPGLVLGLLLSLAGAAIARAEEETLWQIG